MVGLPVKYMYWLFLQRTRRNDWYHSHVCPLNTKARLFIGWAQYANPPLVAPTKNSIVNSHKAPQNQQQHALDSCKSFCQLGMIVSYISVKSHNHNVTMLTSITHPLRALSRNCSSLLCHYQMGLVRFRSSNLFLYFRHSSLVKVIFSIYHLRQTHGMFMGVMPLSWWPIILKPQLFEKCPIEPKVPFFRQPSILKTSASLPLWLRLALILTI